MPQKSLNNFLQASFWNIQLDNQKQSYDQLKNVGFIAKYTSDFKRDNSNDTGLSVDYYSDVFSIVILPIFSTLQYVVSVYVCTFWN